MLTSIAKLSMTTLLSRVGIRWVMSIFLHVLYFYQKDKNTVEKWSSVLTLYYMVLYMAISIRIVRTEPLSLTTIKSVLKVLIEIRILY